MVPGIEAGDGATAANGTETFRQRPKRQWTEELNSGTLSQEERQKVEKLKDVFRSHDHSGNGTLSFEEFSSLLKSGNAKFSDRQVQMLFTVADQDLSGQVDFDEFVDYIFSRVDMEKLFLLEKNAGEEEAKGALLAMPQDIRRRASKRAKENGIKWSDLTWRERHNQVLELQKELEEHSELREQASPAADPTSVFGVKSTPRDDSGRLQPATAPVRKFSPRPMREPSKERGSGGVEMLMARTQESVLPGLTSKFAVARMSQGELVDFSLNDEEISDWTRGDDEALREIMGLKDNLANSPTGLREFHIKRFIAKGTAGWVFLAARRDSGEEVALKLIRMTQSFSGIKEWYLSQRLRVAGIKGVVCTDHEVHVLARATAPAAIAEQLKNAGPVPYYMCMVQELMPWGTIEDLAKEGELSPEIMCKCMEDVAMTLADMHGNSMQHLDVKPENIMLEMDEGHAVTAAKLCDFGSSRVGTNETHCREDVRRFGVTLFSVATGEPWTKNRLMHERPQALLGRLQEAVVGCPDATMQRLPGVLGQILSGDLRMNEVASLMSDLTDAYRHR